jgi:hypothetical protein
MTYSRLLLLVLLACLLIALNPAHGQLPTATATATATPVVTAAPQGRWTAEAETRNRHIVMQFDDRYAWSCEFPTAIVSVTGTATHLQGGVDGSPCVGLLTNLQVNVADATEAVWLLAPGSLDQDEEHVCWVHLVATDADGTRTCDGVVTVKQKRPAT